MCYKSRRSFVLVLLIRFLWIDSKWSISIPFVVTVPFGLILDASPSVLPRWQGWVGSSAPPFRTRSDKVWVAWRALCPPSSWMVLWWWPVLPDSSYGSNWTFHNGLGAPIVMPKRSCYVDYHPLTFLPLKKRGKKNCVKLCPCACAVSGSAIVCCKHSWSYPYIMCNKSIICVASAWRLLPFAHFDCLVFFRA